MIVVVTGRARNQSVSPLIVSSKHARGVYIYIAEINIGKNPFRKIVAHPFYAYVFIVRIIRRPPNSRLVIALPTKNPSAQAPPADPTNNDVTPKHLLPPAPGAGISSGTRRNAARNNNRWPPSSYRFRSVLFRGSVRRPLSALSVVPCKYAP